MDNQDPLQSRNSAPSGFLSSMMLVRLLKVDEDFAGDMAHRLFSNLANELGKSVVKYFTTLYWDCQRGLADNQDPHSLPFSAA